jgi:hypothetical protein
MLNNLVEFHQIMDTLSDLPGSSRSRCSYRPILPHSVLSVIARHVILCHHQHMKWWVLLAIGALVLARGAWMLAAVYFVPALGVCYLMSLHRHPRRVCRACGGTGRHRAAMFWWGDRACTKCAGSPRHRRWGVQLFHGAQGKQTWAEKAASQARQRPGAPR